MNSSVRPTSGARRPSRPGQRHEHSLATRKAIVVAAAQRFAEVGYHGATLSEILSRSGVTKGAMYFHFPTKEAVADAVIAATDTIWTELLAELEAREWDPLHTVIVLTEQVVDRVRHDPIGRGGVRLLNDAGVTVGQGAAHYQLAEQGVATLLGEAAAAGVSRGGGRGGAGPPGRDPDAGHHLICERSGTLDELPDRVAATWAALLPLIATDDWLAQHHTRG